MHICIYTYTSNTWYAITQHSAASPMEHPDLYEYLQMYTYMYYINTYVCISVYIYIYIYTYKYI